MNFSRARLYPVFLVLIVHLFASRLAFSQEVSFSGFSTIGITYSAGDELGFRNSLLNTGREGLSFAPDSVLGLQTNVKFSDDLDAVGQIIVQDRHDTAFTNFLELAFLRYQINRNWSAKIGRFSTNSYLFTDYRYVGHLLTWTRPPIEMYSTVGSLGNMDGLQASYIYDVDFGAVKLALSYGERKFHNDGDAGKVRVDYTDFMAFNVELQATDWRIHGALLTAKLEDFIFPGVEDLSLIDQQVPPIFKPYAQQIQYSIIPDGRRVSYASIGAQYSIDSAEFIAELSNYDSDWGLANGARSGYVSASYNLEAFTPFISFAFYNRTEEPEVIDFAAAQADLPGPLFKQLLFITAGSNDSVLGGSIQQNSVSLGLRWDFSSAWSFKVQFDHFRVDKFGSGLFKELTTSRPSEKFTYNVANMVLTTTF